MLIADDSLANLANSKQDDDGTVIVRGLDCTLGGAARELLRSCPLLEELSLTEPCDPTALLPVLRVLADHGRESQGPTLSLLASGDSSSGGRGASGHTRDVGKQLCKPLRALCVTLNDYSNAAALEVRLLAILISCLGFTGCGCGRVGGDGAASVLVSSVIPSRPDLGRFNAARSSNRSLCSLVKRWCAGASTPTADGLRVGGQCVSCERLAVFEVGDAVAVQGGIHRERAPLYCCSIEVSTCCSLAASTSAHFTTRRLCCCSLRRVNLFSLEDDGNRHAWTQEVLRQLELFLLQVLPCLSVTWACFTMCYVAWLCSCLSASKSASAPGSIPSSTRECVCPDLLTDLRRFCQFLHDCGLSQRHFWLDQKVQLTAYPPP